VRQIEVGAIEKLARRARALGWSSADENLGATTDESAAPERETVPDQDGEDEDEDEPGDGAPGQ
jgi:hypothetical protein